MILVFPRAAGRISGPSRAFQAEHFVLTVLRMAPPQPQQGHGQPTGPGAAGMDPTLPGISAPSPPGDAARPATALWLNPPISDLEIQAIILHRGNPKLTRKKKKLVISSPSADSRPLRTHITLSISTYERCSSRSTTALRPGTGCLPPSAGIPRQQP